MFKKLTTGLIALSMALMVGSSSFAQTARQLNVFSEELVSPLKYDVKTGETLNLEIKNSSNQNVYFRVPLMDVSVEIPKNSRVVVPINFSNPADKNIWFIVQQEGSNNKTGQFAVIDYTVKVPTSNVDRIDTSPLNDIINYDTTFVYEEKPEPVYRTTPSVSTYQPSYSTSSGPVEKPIYTEPEPEPVSKPVSKPSTGGYVRGYW
jgi:hypothetical protein